MSATKQVNNVGPRKFKIVKKASPEIVEKKLSKASFRLLDFNVCDEDNNNNNKSREHSGNYGDDASSVTSNGSHSAASSDSG